MVGYLSTFTRFIRAMSKPYVSIEDPNSKDNLEKLEKSQRWVFGATFINYAMAHWTRK